MNIDRSIQILQRHLPQAMLDTAYMVLVSAAIALVLGGLIGLLLYLTGHPLLYKNKRVYGIAGFIINAVRSLPFIILMFALSPVAVALTGRQIGWQAATVSLSIAATAFFSRIAENAFLEVDRGIIEASIAAGASIPLILWEVVIPESLPGLIRGVSITLISLIGFSAMAGAIGAGGIGDLAIQYGYNMYDDVVMFVTVVILILIVQVLQIVGDILANAASKK